MLLAAAIFVLAALCPQAAIAQDVAAEVEVRVAAQRLADGRTEFALQEREADGSWAARRLPARRFFPAGARVGRWLSSSPLTVEVQSDSVLTDAQIPGVEVRVAAQRLADDRMEFALQEREADGSWGARRLPTRRMFPAGADVGRWLSSSALTVVVAEPVLTPVSPESCVLADNLDAVMSATVQVQTTTGAGTAFYIGDDEWITAAHVVEGGGAIRLRTDTLDREATVIGRDDDVDLALLRASGEGLTGLAFGDHAALRVGQTLGMAGYPVTVSGSPSVTSGLLSKVVEAGGATYLQTDAAANPGNSGAPLFTDCGAVVGVVVAKAVDEAIEGIAWAVALPTINDRLPQLRGAQDGAPAEEAALTITAMCNRQWDGEQWQRPQTGAACRAAAEGGLQTGDGWRWIAGVRGVEDWANVVYRFDGGPSFGRGERWAAFDALASGLHTIEAREWRDSAWTAWSAPYAFTIRGGEGDAAAPAATLTITAICNQRWDAASGRLQRPETAEACRAAAAAGLRTGGDWHWFTYWVGDIKDAGNVVHRFDGGPAFSFGSTEDDTAFDALGPGQHTIEIREHRDGEWTAWSAPFSFTVRAPAPLTITAICNTRWDAASGTLEMPETSDACWTAGTTGLRTGPDWHWFGWIEGLKNAANLVVRFDGGTAVSAVSDEDRAAFDALGPGAHTIQVRECQGAACNDWSAPYTFSIREPRDATPPRIDAICNMRWDGERWRYPDVADRQASPDCGRLRTGAGWSWMAWHWNVGNFENIAYRFDGGAAFRRGSAEDLAAFDALAPGDHTIEVRERRYGGWTVWSAPLTFTIRSLQPLRITAFCNAERVGDRWYRHDGAEACTAAAVGGLRKGEPWDIWITGLENWDNLRYSVDGGRATSWRALNPRKLAAGQHTIEVRERRGGEWTAWSAPYTFTILAPDATRPLTITGICNAVWKPGIGWTWPGTAAECRASASAGLLTAADQSWIAIVRGYEDWGRVVYRFDGGAPFSFASVEDYRAFAALAPGEHTIEARERRGGGWTPWSAPYTFTTRRR